MAKRTQIKNFEKIEKGSDLEDFVKDKRTAKRANKKKATRRNRHYKRELLKHLTEDVKKNESNK